MLGVLYEKGKYPPIEDSKNSSDQSTQLKFNKINLNLNLSELTLVNNHGFATKPNEVVPAEVVGNLGARTKFPQIYVPRRHLIMPVEIEEREEGK